MKKKIIYFTVLFIVIVSICIGSSWLNKIKLYVTDDITTFTKNQSNLYLAQDYKDAPVVFPDEINNEMIVNEYSRTRVMQGFSNVGGNIVLDITYSSDAYNNEIQRLEGWKRQYSYNNEQGSVGFLYDESNFEYPAFVAAYNCFLGYEYALILGNYRIMYVYISRINRGETSLLEEHLPKNYFEKNASLEGFYYSVYHNKHMWNYEHKIEM